MKMGLNVKFKVPSLFKSVKYCLAAVNVVFVIAGFLLLIVGIVVLSSYSNYEEMIINRFFNIPSFTVATGVLIMLVAVLGFYGAISQSFYAITAYVVLLAIVLVFELAIVIAAYKLSNDSTSAIRASMLESLQLYSTRLDVARMWDNMQTEFKCCGVAGRFDYVSNQIPISCCHMDYGTISPFECGTMNAHNDGCAVALGDWLGGKANALAVCALIATCIQVLVLSASAWFAWRSKFEEVELEQ